MFNWHLFQVLYYLVQHYMCSIGVHHWSQHWWNVLGYLYLAIAGA